MSIFISCAAIFVTILLLANNCAGQVDDTISNELHAAWKRARQVEPDKGQQIARLIGYIEGRFEINVPDVWQREKGRVFEDHADVIFNKEFEDGCKAKLALSNDPSQSDYPILQFDDARNQIAWKHELSALAPRVIFGPVVIYADLAENKKRVFVLGQIGVVRFVRILDRSSGAVLSHFAFMAGSDENMGR